jgi:hypothetical protein
MPSLSDIPEDLRSAEKRTAFVEYVFELAVDFSVKRRLVHLWSKLTSTHLTPDEWLKLESSGKKLPNA